jgi:hypothetical protein
MNEDNIDIGDSKLFLASATRFDFGSVVWFEAGKGIIGDRWGWTRDFPMGYLSSLMTSASGMSVSVQSTSFSSFHLVLSPIGSITLPHSTSLLGDDGHIYDRAHGHGYEIGSGR